MKDKDPKKLPTIDEVSEVPAIDLTRLYFMYIAQLQECEQCKISEKRTSTNKFRFTPDFADTSLGKNENTTTYNCCVIL